MSAFSSLSSDCISVIFTFHIQRISSPSAAKCRKRKRQEIPTMLSRHDLVDPDSAYSLVATNGRASTQIGAQMQDLPIENKPVPVRLILSRQELRFYSTLVSCFEFDSNVDVDAFFRSITRKNGRQSPIFHVSANSNDSVRDGTMRYLRGARSVEIAEAHRVTDAGVAQLRGVEHLVIRGCKKLTNKAFSHLAGIASLDMSSCDQESISDEAYTHLAGIRSLDMSNCTQSTITNKAFLHLTGLQNLSMNSCNQSTISNEAFTHLRSLTHLSMNHCNQDAISDGAFTNFENLQSLEMNFCTQSTITDKAFQSLRNVRSLSMIACSQDTITQNAFVNLRALKSLDISFCNERTISESVMVHLEGLTELRMLGFKRSLKWSDALREKVFCVLKCDFVVREESIVMEKGMVKGKKKAGILDVVRRLGRRLAGFGVMRSASQQRAQ